VKSLETKKSGGQRAKTEGDNKKKKKSSHLRKIQPGDKFSRSSRNPLLLASALLGALSLSLT
jgi:hypothetical protein